MCDATPASVHRPAPHRHGLLTPQPCELPSPSSRLNRAGLTGHPVLVGLKCESRTFLPYRLSGLGAVLNVAHTDNPPGIMKEPAAGHENNCYQRGYRYSNLRPYTTGMLWMSLQGCIYGVSQVDIPVAPPR